MRYQAQGPAPARWWLHILLLALTLVTTTVFGYALAASFSSGHPLSEEFLSDGYSRLLHGIWALRAGLTYSIPLLLILLAHELGHYFTCRRWHVEASLPYFGPAPTLLGTVGAFIRIRSPIYNRRSLFDIGVSGPLAGFALLAPFLFAGVLMSRVVRGGQMEGPFTFGTPLLLRAFEAIRFPGVATGDISLHPMAMAAWAGLLATAINLLPVGQLDGGHISYALFGERGHRLLSLLLIAVLAICGFLYWPWWLWAVAMFFFRRHPLIYDKESLGTPRRLLAVTALLLFVISICIVPVR
jgi:membrane-associated protease RseP (regulator of RpoE activity)